MTTFDDVLLQPQLGVLRHRAEADIATAVAGEHWQYPFIAAPMPAIASTQLVVEACRLGAMAVTHRFQGVAEQIEQAQTETRAYNAIGLDEYRYQELVDAGVTKFCLDIAHAHSLAVAEFFETVKVYDHHSWMIGNVATAEAARFLMDTTPAHAIKVGIGPGSVCTTREVTGHGVPQLSAIQDVAGAVEGRVAVIADGGIRNSGDIVKAIAAGADAVMLGRLFALALEAKNNGDYYGCASDRVNGHRAPEGVHVKVEGMVEPLEDIIKRLAWGLRSGISYGGATNIYELAVRARFIPVSGNGLVESRTR